MGIIFVLFLQSVLANCEMGFWDGNNFHTVATYADRTENNRTIDKFEFIDGFAFLFKRSAAMDISGVKGINCPDLKTKHSVGDIEDRTILRLSGCSKSELGNDLLVYQGNLTKMSKTITFELKLTDEMIKQLKHRIQQSGLLTNIKVKDSIQLVAKDEAHDLQKSMSEYKLDKAISFDVLGKKVNWYLFSAVGKFKLMALDKNVIKGGERTKVETFYDDPLPLVVYEYDNKLSYFGNGLHGGCELYYRAEVSNHKIDSFVPYYLPSGIYEIFGATKEVMVRVVWSQGSAGKAFDYLWNIETNTFKVISGDSPSIEY